MTNPTENHWKDLPHLFGDDDEWVFVFGQKVENAPDFESFVFREEETLSADIFLVAQ